MQLFIDKVEFVSFRKLVLLLCVLCGLCVKISAQEFKTIKPGVEYAEVTTEISGKQIQMNLLRLDLKKVRLDVHHAMDAAIGTEKTSSIATRHGAFAAINAGFFRLDKSIWAGDPVGILKIDGELLSEDINGRIALGILNDRKKTKVSFGHVKSITSLARHTGYRGMIDGINREPKANEIILFTSGMVTPLETAEHIEVIVPDATNPRVWVLKRTKGGTIVPKKGYVIYFGHETAESPSDRSNSWPEGWASVMSVPILDGSTSRSFLWTEDIVAGVPQLIKNSKIDITWEQEKTTKSFVETRHPRTAVAKLKDGKFLMITVDGRSEASGGIGLQDLAEYLLSLGAIDAMNLDGGGSTTMFVDGKVVNKPSDKEGERKVSDAILVTLRTRKN